MSTFGYVCVLNRLGGGALRFIKLYYYMLLQNRNRSLYNYVFLVLDFSTQISALLENCGAGVCVSIIYAFSREAVCKLAGSRI